MTTSPAPASEDIIFAVESVSVTFPGVRALDRASLSLQRGEVRALVGRNGAGKSTLVRILSGAQAPDSGEVLIDGRPVTLASPSEALHRGIATVYQELTIVPGLSVAENVTLGRWETKGLGRIDRAAMRKAAKKALDMLGVDLDLSMPAGQVDIARRQLIEIARSLLHEPRLLILDEPTSSLPAHEADNLLAVVRRLAANGVAVLYVSHRMDEIGRVADQVTVMRDGKVQVNLPVAEAPVDRIAELMVGEDVQFTGRDAPPNPGREAPVLLAAVDLRDDERLNGMSISVRAGEIVGIAGLLGSGRTEFLRAIAGIGRLTGGLLEVNGQRVPRVNPGVMIGHGVTLVPEDRKGEGLVLVAPIIHNLVMSSLSRVSRFGTISSTAEERLAAASKEQLDIKLRNTGDAAQTLSGGNQQKVVVGRCLNAGARILLMDEPTRGIDLQAKQQIYDLVRDLGASGHGVVVVSSEYEELLLLCHRIVLVQDGRIIGEVDPLHTTLPQLLAAIMRKAA